MPERRTAELLCIPGSEAEAEAEVSVSVSVSVSE